MELLNMHDPPCHMVQRVLQQIDIVKIYKRCVDWDEKVIKTMDMTKTIEKFNL